MESKVEEFYGVDKLCVGFALSGIGGHLSQMLLSVPGATKVLTSLVINYSKNSTIGYAKPFSVAKFNSLKLSKALSLKCLLNMYSEQSIVTYRKVVAVGATAALSSNYERRGKNRAFITVRSLKMIRSRVITLGGNERTRAEQERIISNCILALACAECGIKVTMDECGLIESDLVEEGVEVEEAIPRYFSLQPGYMIHLLFDQGLRRRDSFKEVKLVFSGSFDPLHIGHKKLLRHGIDHLNLTYDNVLCEITISHPDKGILSQKEILNRMNQFQGEVKVAITSASLYIDKARLFPNTTFLIGFDTYLRIVDRRYYDNSQEKRDAVLQEFARLGIVFLVGGRMVNTEYAEYGEEELRSNGKGNLFMSLPDFRVDISSTEIREGKSKNADE